MTSGYNGVLHTIQCEGSAYNEWALLRSLLSVHCLKQGAKDLIEGRPRAVNAVRVTDMCDRTGSTALKALLLKGYS